MIIIGVDNTFHLGKETISFLKSVAEEAHICCVHLKASQTRGEIRRFEAVIASMIESKMVKLCIVEFSNRSLVCLKKVSFDGIIFFDEKIGYKTYTNHHIYFIKNKIQSITVCNTFILPDTTKFRLNKDISYGWSKAAHISLTSSEEGLGGMLYVQCILQHPTKPIEGAFSTPREFGVDGKARYPEQLLAAVAALILCGFNLNKTKYNLE